MAGCIVGVTEHGNSAVLVTVAPGGELLDRRRIDLTERGLPTHPHHHEGSWAVGRYLNSPWARAFSLADAVALVERVREAAARGARESLEALAAAVPVPIASIAIRACPELPPTTEERIADNRAQTVADSVMYREALRPPPRRAAGPCIGTIASACFATRRRRSAATTSTRSCARWADRSGRLGRPHTSSRPPRRSRPPARSLAEWIRQTRLRHAAGMRFVWPPRRGPERRSHPIASAGGAGGL